MKKLLLLITLFATVLTSKAQVVASFNVSDSVICAGQDIIFTFTGQGATLYQWDFGDGTVLHTTTNSITTRNFRDVGTYKVYLFATNGSATDTADIYVRVRPKIESSFSFNEISNSGYYCLGTTLSISQWSNIEGYDSLIWDFGDGTTSNLLYPKHTYTAVDDYTVKLKVMGYCGEGEYTEVVKIVDDARGKPQAGLSVSPALVCPNQVLNFSAWPGNTPVDSFRVYPGDGSSARLDDFDYAYSMEGQYEVMAVSYNRCGADTNTQQILVTNTPMRSGSIYINNQDACVGQVTRGSVNSQSTNRSYINYGDGTSDTIENGNGVFSHKYANSGSYTIEVTFEYPCGQGYTTTKTLTIGTGPDVFNFSINSYRNQYCLGEITQFSAPWLYPGDTLFVDFGDGKTETFVDTLGQMYHLYEKVGNYTVKATKSNVCGFSRQSQGYVKVVDDAKPRLTMAADYRNEGKPVCAGDTIMLSMQAEGYTLQNASFVFDDGSIDTGLNTLHVFNTGEHRIKATAKNLCGVDLTAYTTLNVINHTANPSLSYYNYPQVQCVNQAFFFDVFANGAKSIMWDMGDGNTLMSDPNMPHFMYAYTNPGAYNVSIVARNGCGSTSARSLLQVEAGPDMSMTHTDLNINIGDTVRFVNTSKDKSRQFWVFEMNLDDTTSALEVAKSYPEKGTYVVSLFGMNEFGCWDTINKTVRVGVVSVYNAFDDDPLYVIYPNPANDFVRVKSMTGSLPTAVRFKDITGKELSVEFTLVGDGSYECNVSGLPNGVYFLQIIEAKQQYKSRIVIQR